MTYILEFYRDEKHRGEAKGAIYLDSCVEIVKAQKKSGKLVCFDIVMQDKSRFSLGRSENNPAIIIVVLGVKSD